MLTENGLEVDLQAVGDVLRNADVLTIGFTTFAPRLLIDTRSNRWDGPMVAIVGPVATVQERYLWLGRHRGAFGVPEGFSFFVWPHSVRNLVERDVLAPLRTRLAAASTGSDAALDAQLTRLLEIERDAWRGAITGDPGAWQTLWSRAA